MVAGADASALGTTLAEHLPALGIPAYAVTRLSRSRASTELAIVARLAPNALSRPLHFIANTELGIDPALEREETLVVEPLEFAGTEVGIAAFAWGARNPVHYEVLREVLSLAVYALVSKA